MVENLSSPVANALTLTLMHFLWQGSLVALSYWALLEATGVRSVRIRYSTSLLALSVMALCPLVTFASVYDPAATVDETLTATAGGSRSLPAETPGPPAVISRDGTFANQGDSASGPAAGGRTGVAGVRPALEALQPYVLLLWLAGVMLSGARFTAGLLHVFWLRSGRTEISAELAERSLTLARRLGLKHARTFASTRIREAAVVGFWKPVVLLPASWLMLLPTDVLVAVIAHELAHIRRFDVWANLLQRMLEVLLFYHPAVWWLSNRIRLEREMCCDELAVDVTGARGSYVVALEQVARLQVLGTLRLAPSFTGDRKMRLLSRIQNVLGMSGKPEGEPAWLVGIVAVAIPLVLVGVGGVFTGQNAVVAQDVEGGRSAEAEAGPRPSAEGEGTRRSAEAEAGPRRSAEAEAGPRRSVEGADGSRAAAERQAGPDGGDALAGFKPQTPREAALFQMLLQLQQELAALRKEVRSQDVRGSEGTGRRDGEGEIPVTRTDGDLPALPTRWETSTAGRAFKAYDKNGDLTVTLDEWLAMTNGNVSAARRQLQTQRFHEAGPGSDGKLDPAEFIHWWNTREGAQRGPRDGEGGQRGPRDGEGGQRGPRDGEGGQRGPRDGEGGQRGPRDGEGAAKRGPRDGE